VRILFLSDTTLMNPASGAERVLYQQAKGLADRGMKVLAITRSDANQTSLSLRKVSAVEEACYSAPTNNAFLFLAASLRLTAHLYKNFIKANVFDVTVCHQPLTCFALRVAGKLPKIPLCYVFLSPWHEEYLLSHQDVNAVKVIFPSMVRRLIERLCLKRAQKIMVLSRYMMEKLQRIHNVAAQRVVINPGGVDLDRFSPPLNRYDLKNEMKLSPDLDIKGIDDLKNNIPQTDLYSQYEGETSLPRDPDPMASIKSESQINYERQRLDEKVEKLLKG